MDITNIILALSTIIIGVIIVKLLSKYTGRIKDTKAFKSLIKNSGYSEALLWYSSYFIKLGLYIVVSLIAISFLGFAQQVLTLMAVILSLSIIGVLAYSLRDLIPSAFAGYYLMHSKLVNEGDTIKVKEFEGKVTEVNLLTTIIKDSKGGMILIPNKIIMEKILRKK
ncbi:MAG: mechanosensitive ion channel domain-containing protein [Candidatus Nanoarchaeia archaeon]|jgi:small-conductance mechanosensitive channel